MDSAAALFEESLVLCRALGDRRDLGFVLFDLGVLALDRGEVEKGQEYLQESFSLFFELRDPFGIAAALLVSSLTRLAQAQPARALRLGAASFNLMESIDLVPPRFFQEKAEGAMAAARQMLDAEAADAVWQQGWGMSLEQAIAEMLEA